MTFIDGWNDRCHPFVWTKTADQILDHCKPGPRTSFTTLGKRSPLATAWRALDRELDRFINQGLAAA